MGYGVHQFKVLLARLSETGLQYFRGAGLRVYRTSCESDLQENNLKGKTYISLLSLHFCFCFFASDFLCFALVCFLLLVLLFLMRLQLLLLFVLFKDIFLLMYTKHSAMSALVPFIHFISISNIDPGQNKTTKTLCYLTQRLSLKSQSQISGVVELLGTKTS